MEFEEEDLTAYKDLAASMTNGCLDFYLEQPIFTGRLSDDHIYELTLMRELLQRVIEARTTLACDPNPAAQTVALKELMFELYPIAQRHEWSWTKHHKHFDICFIKEALRLSSPHHQS